MASAVLPALSVAVQLTVLVPTVFVSSAPQLCAATPDSASFAPAAAVALPFRSTGLGETPGLSVGGVASRLMVTVCVFVPPALLASQVSVIASVSVLTVVGAHPVDDVDVVV